MQNMKITIQEAYILLETYGGAEANWPESKRDALRSLIAQTPELQALKAREIALDLKLSQKFERAPENLINDTISHMIAQDQQIVFTPRQKIFGFSTLVACLTAGITLAPYMTLYPLEALTDDTSLAMTSLEIWTSTNR